MNNDDNLQILNTNDNNPEPENKISIFDMPKFPSTTKPYTFTPTQLYNALMKYQNTEIHIKDALRNAKIPYGSFNDVKDIYPDIANLWEQAQVKKLEIYKENIVKISDNTDNDLIEGTLGDRPNMAAVKRSELKIRTRQWLLERLNPSKYGPKQEIITKNLNTNININIDIVDIFGMDISDINKLHDSKRQAASK